VDHPGPSRSIQKLHSIRGRIDARDTLADANRFRSIFVYSPLLVGRTRDSSTSLNISSRKIAFCDGKSVPASPIFR
jgi:hypothetical protein